VYLSGTKYETCKSCGYQRASIPAVKQLMQVIAGAVVNSDAALTGPEIRFLRKRLGKKSAEFAKLISVGIEEVSRWENGHVTPSRSADKLIRVFYSMVSGDRRLTDCMNKNIDEWLDTVAIAQELQQIKHTL
jgi:putative zinc finger/helix-turn-helix YgiT family protein